MLDIWVFITSTHMYIIFPYCSKGERTMTTMTNQKAKVLTVDEASSVDTRATPV